MTPKEFKKKYPDLDANGYPCKVVYPTEKEFESQVVMCKLIKPSELFGTLNELRQSEKDKY